MLEEREKGESEVKESGRGGGVKIQRTYRQARPHGQGSERASERLSPLGTRQVVSSSAPAGCQAPLQVSSVL